jgi:glutathione S-transferase
MSAEPILNDGTLPSWEALSTRAKGTATGSRMERDDEERSRGAGSPHTDALVRLFGTTDEPRVVYYRDKAAWCPYCQKVWILLEEKKIPYKVEKINMRSYGDKPMSYLQLVPNGLLPAMRLDGEFMTESLDIMLTLEHVFTGPQYKRMWPVEGTAEHERAKKLMRLERELFRLWCDLVFRPGMGNGPRQRFEAGLDEVNKELEATPGPWFLSDLSIVDLTYITHVERMCASVAFWSGLKMRGDGRWPAIERWMEAFEDLPSYMATKSDYYTHVMDIPPQYGPGYSLPGSEAYAARISGRDGSWKLPLAPLSAADLEPYGPRIDQGEEAARHEAALKIARNHENVAKFALRGAGEPGAKRFQVSITH